MGIDRGGFADKQPYRLHKWLSYSVPHIPEVLVCPHFA